MTSDNDPLSDIFSQMAAEEMVDPAVFDQRLEAAFDHDGSGFDELLPDNDDFSTGGDATDFSIGPDLTTWASIRGAADSNSGGPSAEVSRRLRITASAAFAAIRYIQLVNFESPRNLPMFCQAAINASCSASSASGRLAVIRRHTAQIWSRLRVTSSRKPPGRLLDCVEPDHARSCRSLDKCRRHPAVRQRNRSID